MSLKRILMAPRHHSVRFSGFSIRLEELKIAPTRQGFQACPSEFDMSVHTGVSDETSAKTLN